MDQGLDPHPVCRLEYGQCHSGTQVCITIYCWCEGVRHRAAARHPFVPAIQKKRVANTINAESKPQIAYI